MDRAELRRRHLHRLAMLAPRELPMRPAATRPLPVYPLAATDDEIDSIREQASAARRLFVDALHEVPR
jgi:hypothetical protein